MNEWELIEELTKEINVNPKNTLAFKVRATLKADIGEYEEAIKDFDKAIKIDPFDFSALFSRATLKADLGDMDGAIEDFKKATAVDFYKAENQELLIIKG
jgi:Tfp pilus assembly protein PilF